MKKSILYMALSLCLTGALAGCSGREADAAPGAGAEQPGVIMLEEIRSVNKLVLARMTISKMGVVRDRVDLSKAKGWKQVTAGLVDAVKIGSRKAAYSYDTYMQAYIDLSALSPDDITVDEESRTVTLRLPEIRTEFIGRDIPLREEHYRVTGLRSAVDAEERADVKERMNTRLRPEVEANPRFRTELVQKAEEKGRLYFRTLLGSEGYDVNVVFGR